MNNTATSWDELPLVLRVVDVQTLLDISKPTALALFHRADFPVIRMGGRGLRVGRDALRVWLDKQAAI